MLRASIAAALFALAGPASAQTGAADMDALARDLAAKPAADEAGAKPAAGEPAAKSAAGETDPCTVPMRDGKLPTCIDDTRQVVFGGARAKAVSVARAGASAASVRRDISMTFEKGSAALTAAACARLDALAAALARVGSYRPFTVEGHTDRSGARATNVALSRARARSVVAYLADKGVDASRMRAEGFGYDRLLRGVAPTSPANRRVEVSAP